MQFTEEFLEKLTEANRIVFFTGAGISAESGVSTFRGKEGIWNKIKPEELASFDAFLKNPNMVWEWYQYRRKIVNEAAPNPGHLAIAEFEKYFKDVCVVTQNVDNLHARAGSSYIYELHGNIERNYCINCKTFYNKDELQFSEKTPICKICSGLIRPDVVWFGELLPEQIFIDAESKAIHSDICFVVGTSALVYPAANIPILAKRSGSYLVEVNIESTELSRFADHSFIGKSGEILPKILNEVKNLRTV